MRLVYHDNKKLPSNDLLKVNNSVAIPQGNLETLATEIFKVKNELTPKTMTRILKLKNLVRFTFLRQSFQQEKYQIYCPIVSI